MSLLGNGGQGFQVGFAGANVLDENVFNNASVSVGNLFAVSSPNPNTDQVRSGQGQVRSGAGWMGEMGILRAYPAHI
jgi:hypothetical protein